MICSDDSGFDLEGCDIIYENYGTRYGIKTGTIWDGIRSGSFVVSVVSNVGALNEMRQVFGRLLRLVYVHSQSTVEDFRHAAGETDEYVERRAADYRMAFNIYLDNFLLFDHVLIWSGDRENLFDQVFRLFRAYEQGLLRQPRVRSPQSKIIVSHPKLTAPLTIILPSSHSDWTDMRGNLNVTSADSMPNFSTTFEAL